MSVAFRPGPIEQSEDVETATANCGTENDGPGSVAVPPMSARTI